MKQWEYKVIDSEKGWLRGFNSMEDQLNQLGNNGWELVSSTPLMKWKSENSNDQLDVGSIKLIFKREKS